MLIVGIRKRDGLEPRTLILKSLLWTKRVQEVRGVGLGLTSWIRSQLREAVVFNLKTYSTHGRPENKTLQ